VCGLAENRFSVIFEASEIKVGSQFDQKHLRKNGTSASIPEFSVETFADNWHVHL